MLDSLVFDAARYLSTCRRLQEFRLQGLQRCGLLQREGREFGCGCCGGRAWGGSPIRQKQLGCAAKAVTSDFGANLLVSALLGRRPGRCWLGGQMLMPHSNGSEEKFDKLTPSASFCQR